MDKHALQKQGHHTCGLLNRLMALRLESGSADQSAAVMVKRHPADKATHRRVGGNLAAINKPKPQPHPLGLFTFWSAYA